jgi:hypothetical protein
MPDVVTVRKDELLGVLRANRSGHRETFLRAQEGFRQRVIEELERTLEDARQGRQVELSFRLPQPEDHTGDYDREIRMLEMHTGSTVDVASHLFDQIVMDRWGWSERFEATSSRYLR